MSLPFGRIHNFSAGPSALPVEVLAELAEGIYNHEGAGMGVMEMSHRSPEFEAILAQTEADLRELLSVPPNFRVLFLQGGASTQFSLLPMNLGFGGAHVITGTWGQKAVEVNPTAKVVYDAGAPYRSIPASMEFSVDAPYLHITSNETIQGIQLPRFVSANVPVVADVSSDILSRPIDFDGVGMLYAGAQKNLGPAGVTIVLIRQDFLDRAKCDVPMSSYSVQAKSGSLYNTPPTWSIYVTGRVLAYWKRLGGLPTIAAQNAAKAKLIYDAIDGSDGFYVGHADRNARSQMNVTFTLRDAPLTSAFLVLAEAAGLSGLAGHRSVGGIRASLYNCVPLESAIALADFLHAFAGAKG